MNTEKLVKVLELTNSPVDGEALNAIRIANQLLKKENLSWASLIAKPRVHTQPWSTTPPWPHQQRSQAEAAAQAKSNKDKLVEEMFDVVMPHVAGKNSEDFIESLHDAWEKYGRLTPKQYAALHKFYENALRR